MHKTNHALHLILSILTLGLWLIVWLAVIFRNWQLNKLEGYKGPDWYQREVAKPPEQRRAELMNGTNRAGQAGMIVWMLLVMGVTLWLLNL